jgi:hypothetical protein
MAKVHNIVWSKIMLPIFHVCIFWSLYAVFHITKIVASSSFMTMLHIFVVYDFRAMPFFILCVPTIIHYYCVCSITRQGLYSLLLKVQDAAAVSQQK